MRKQVTFVENLKNENRMKNENGHILTRSADSHKRPPHGVEYLPRHQPRDIHTGTHIPTGTHMKTVHSPKCMTTAPFLQHPALTSGQRRYLYSIANIYSTERMRQQMKQHYLNMLHSCLKSGQISACRRRCGDVQVKATVKFRADAEETRPRAQRQNSSSRANSDVILPKIVK